MLETIILYILAGIISSQVVLTMLVLCPRCKLISPNLVRLPRSAIARREIALTFDDGPHAEITSQILDQLDQYNAKASFFCIGEKVAAHPNLVAEILRRGHSVENHSYRHNILFAFSGPSLLANDIVKTQKAVEAATHGPAPRFFRAPFGFRSPFLGGVLRRLGLQHVAWTRRGYDTASRNPDTVLRRLSRNLAAGDILLLHDGKLALLVLPRLLELCQHKELRSISLSMIFQDLKTHPPISEQSIASACGDHTSSTNSPS
ncbi:polysaccharide deacetylase [Acidithiobacillus ferrivorans SS3]|uniref:Polysaccharide deacetylase n=1 Tax=Acidithiobacillus ferrivorans SS3 TaxID=743299 RepID=G0JSK3_9PROT|nr:polysaccharide deacetylase family protein [Acidithiobacillus ferrivorans]AEM48911.1 polysaccharide deacetylase [Acidithiobacillus ferrivorans SS3]MBU2765402.1 polysaccharide deacetylase family protein [Acidithiobacillus ferrivorans]MBU2850255.1 polysaccharide deacetylase family protein [Acidithiobacillus ferrivorans]OFA17803.1 hypothetical protein A4U49_00905 [Acidithiobacillus ferrivorans]